MSEEDHYCTIPSCSSVITYTCHWSAESSSAKLNTTFVATLVQTRAMKARAARLEKSRQCHSSSSRKRPPTDIHLSQQPPTRRTPRSPSCRYKSWQILGATAAEVAPFPANLLLETPTYIPTSSGYSQTKPVVSPERPLLAYRSSLEPYTAGPTPESSHSQQEAIGRPTGLRSSETTDQLVIRHPSFPLPSTSPAVVRKHFVGLNASHKEVWTAHIPTTASNRTAPSPFTPRPRSLAWWRDTELPTRSWWQ